MTTNRQFSSSQETLDNLNLAPHSEDPVYSQQEAAAPSLEAILSAIGPLPPQALFLGVATDGLPVLLNLHDPLPGPLLVIGDAGTGKTAFLQSVARSLVHTHMESDVQFGVVTQRTAEWERLEKTGHYVGVFDVTHSSTQDFILSLTSWAHVNKNSTQSVLVLMDDLESMARMDVETLQNFRWLLLRGPARRVWPIITMNADRYGQVLAWIEIFRARVFGRIENPRVAQALGGDKTSALDQLDTGTEFSLRENGKWLKFRLPSF